MRLSCYTFTVKFIKGADNIADSLSRLCPAGDKEYEDSDRNQEHGNVSINLAALELGERQESDSSDVTTNALRDCTTAITIERVIQESIVDLEIKGIEAALASESSWPDELKAYQPFATDLYMMGDVLLRGSRIVLPRSLRRRAIETTHVSHAGANTMKRALRAKVWWSGMDSDVDKFAKDCKSCSMVSRDNPPPPMTRTELPQRPWEYIAIDFFTPTEITEKVLVIVDYYTRFVVCEPIRTNNADCTIKALENTFNIYGIPRRMKADNGPPFQGNEFKRYCEDKGIVCASTIPYWAPQNGMVERMMKNITRALATGKIDGAPWKQSLAQFQNCYNQTPHTATNVSPVNAMFRRNLRGLLPSYIPDEFYFDEETRDRDRTAKFKGKAAGDLKRRARVNDEIRVGDFVMVHSKATGKLRPNFDEELHEVMERNGGALKLRNECGVMSERYVAQVKRWPPADGSQPDGDGLPALDRQTRKEVPLERVNMPEEGTERRADESAQSEAVEPALKISREQRLRKPITRLNL